MTRQVLQGGGLLLLALFCSGCSTLLGNLKTTESNIRTVDIDQVHSRVTFTFKDGSTKERRVPSDAKIVYDALTGNLTYYNAAFEWQPLFGLDVVPGDNSLEPYIFVGARVAYLGDFGAHFGISASTAEGSQNALAFGLDYKRNNLVIGIHLEQPWYLVDKIPLRPGAMLAAPF